MKVWLRRLAKTREASVSAVLAWKSSDSVNNQLLWLHIHEMIQEGCISSMLPLNVWLLGVDSSMRWFSFRFEFRQRSFTWCLCCNSKRFSSIRCWGVLRNLLRNALLFIHHVNNDFYFSYFQEALLFLH